ncbi:MAG: FCD domain-containing protein [Blastomonas sp.]
MMLVQPNTESLVNRTVRELSDLSLASRPGDHLGAEDALLERLGISRPTLRQAAKIVESQRLIEVRRGIGGGYIASRPDAQDAIRSLARYLRMSGATLENVLEVSGPINDLAAGSAAACKDVQLRGRLEKFRDSIDENDSVSALIRAETELARLIAQMTGNHLIELVMEISYVFGLGERDTGIYSGADSRTQARELQRALCDALLAGDAEIARVIMRRRSAYIHRWLGLDGDENV